MALTLKYGDILAASPVALEKVERVSKKFEEVKQFGSTVLQLCKELNANMSGVCEVYGRLQSVLQEVPLFSEEEKWFRSTCQKSASVLKEMSYVFDDYLTQLNQGVVEPLVQIIDRDLASIGTHRKTYESAVEEREQAMVRFSRVSKKKETERTRFEAQADLYAATKKFHTTAVNYYSELNLFRFSHLGGLATTVMELVNMQGTSFSRASMSVSESGKMTLLMQPHVWRLQHSYLLAKVAVERQRERRLQEFVLTYTPDPDPSDPFMEFQPVDQALRKKAGYIFLRSQRQGAVGVGFRWDLHYCYTKQGRLLMHKGENKSPEVILPLLSCTCSAVEADDRRYVFQCVRGAKVVVLQAMGERDRDEWMTAIGNQSNPEHLSLSVVAKAPQVSGGNEGKKVVEEREKIKKWVSRELSSKKQGKGAPRSEQYNYGARFLGSTLLDEGRSHAVFAAALKKARTDQESVWLDHSESRVSVKITVDGISCYDAVEKEFLTLPWTKLAYCGYVPENEKLFGFVFPACDQKQQQQQRGKQLFTCLMYEAEGSGKAVWTACNAMIKLAHERRQQQKQMKSAKKQKVSSSHQPPDKDTSLQRSDSVHSLLSDISDDLNASINS